MLNHLLNLDVQAFTLPMLQDSIQYSKLLTFKRRRERKVMVPQLATGQAMWSDAKPQPWKRRKDLNIFEWIQTEFLIPMNSQRLVKEYQRMIKSQVSDGFWWILRSCPKNLNQIWWSPMISDDLFDSGLLVPHKGFQNLSVTAPGTATEKHHETSRDHDGNCMVTWW